MCNVVAQEFEILHYQGDGVANKRFWLQRRDPTPSNLTASQQTKYVRTTVCNAADEPKISPTAAEELFWNEIETEVTAEDALDATATSMTKRTEPPPRSSATRRHGWMDINPVRTILSKLIKSVNFITDSASAVHDRNAVCEEPLYECN